MKQSQLYDYTVLLVVAFCAYLLATLGTQGVLQAKQAVTSDVPTAAGGPRKDKATGISFEGMEDKMELMGVGTRKKAILNIYSVGLYVAPKLRKQMDTLTGPARCQSVIDSKASKKVQLKFAMGIGPEKIAEAVSGLAGVDSQVRQDFQTMLIDGMGEGKMKKGETMSFEWKKGLETISVTARGKPIGSMKNKALAQGVLDLYVGPKSVSPSLLDDLQCR
eukprot:CAMPEP_0176060622 /NCGR_PEP_ID=MMETSP0120_2-20121206/30217_1 /TAXON_ID=160619 /ORGANISM="Kryptoperidinium foliaceum, Strain CCMP 1326" /LENGTH=219 /DNA_ID=CAMNT_0017394167 /DNA_START=100 /DNA_END=759 /DNA_ORIENTATION=+